MKFGLNVINFGPGAKRESFIRWHQFAQEQGFQLVMISDHVAITPDVQEGFPAPFYDPFVTLSWLANMTEDVHLGTTVTILPYRHPLQTARMAATIDQLSGGRFILGVGIGWAKQEFDVLGLPFNRRGAMASEFLEIIKLCWQKDVLTYHGRFTSFENVHTAPRPVRPDGIPVWVGGSSEAALQRAVRYGNAWHPYRYRLEWLREKALPALDQMAEAERRRAPAFCPRLSLQLTKTPITGENRPMGHGSLGQVYEDLEALESLGAAAILLDTYSSSSVNNPNQIDRDLDMLQLAAEQLINVKNQTLR